MPELKVTITRYLGDDPQPGIVECELIDAHGRKWLFVDKTAIVSSDDLDATMAYPRPGVIRGEIIARSRDAVGREILVFDMTSPDGVESVEGETRFEVRGDNVLSKRNARR